MKSTPIAYSATNDTTVTTVAIVSTVALIPFIVLLLHVNSITFPCVWVAVGAVATVGAFASLEAFEKK